MHALNGNRCVNTISVIVTAMYSYREGHWVFGGIERGTSEAFMVEVTDRSASTLLPIIQKFIKPGTTIISDEWFRRVASIQQIDYNGNGPPNCESFY